MSPSQFEGPPCFRYSDYVFYKAFKYSNRGFGQKLLTLGDFFFLKILPELPVCIGEVELLWQDSESNKLLSLRLYVQPEHTPNGRQNNTGADEVIALRERLVLRLDDLVPLVQHDITWTYGCLTPSIKSRDGPSCCKKDLSSSDLVVIRNENVVNERQSRDRAHSLVESLTNQNDTPQDHADTSSGAANVAVVSYSRYCRYRAMQKRLEGSDSEWLHLAVVVALGGFAKRTPGCRVMFCRDTFYQAEIDDLSIRMDHKFPVLKGRNKGKKNRQPSHKDSQQDSDSIDEIFANVTPSVLSSTRSRRSTESSEVSEEKVSTEEQDFLISLHKFMHDTHMPIGRIPSLGFKQIDLYYFYRQAEKLGGYDSITQKRKWKHLYDKLGGDSSNTSAATFTRQHYERLLLPYERHLHNADVQKEMKKHQKQTESQSDENRTSNSRIRTKDVNSETGSTEQAVDQDNNKQVREILSESSQSCQHDGLHSCHSENIKNCQCENKQNNNQVESSKCEEKSVTEVMKSIPNVIMSVSNVTVSVPTMTRSMPNIAVSVPNMTVSVPNMTMSMPNMTEHSQLNLKEESKVLEIPLVLQSAHNNSDVPSVILTITESQNKQHMPVPQVECKQSVSSSVGLTSSQHMSVPQVECKQSVSSSVGLTSSQRLSVPQVECKQSVSSSVSLTSSQRLSVPQVECKQSVNSSLGLTSAQHMPVPQVECKQSVSSSVGLTSSQRLSVPQVECKQSVSSSVGLTSSQRLSVPQVECKQSVSSSVGLTSSQRLSVPQVECKQSVSSSVGLTSSQRLSVPQVECKQSVSSSVGLTSSQRLSVPQVECKQSVSSSVGLTSSQRLSVPQVECKQSVNSSLGLTSAQHMPVPQVECKQSVSSSVGLTSSQRLSVPQVECKQSVSSSVGLTSSQHLSVPQDCQQSVISSVGLASTLPINTFMQSQISMLPDANTTYTGDCLVSGVPPPTSIFVPHIKTYGEVELSNIQSKDGPDTSLVLSSKKSQDSVRDIHNKPSTKVTPLSSQMMSMLGHDTEKAGHKNTSYKCLLSNQQVSSSSHYLSSNHHLASVLHPKPPGHRSQSRLPPAPTVIYLHPSSINPFSPLRPFIESIPASAHSHHPRKRVYPFDCAAVPSSKLFPSPGKVLNRIRNSTCLPQRQAILPVPALRQQFEDPRQIFHQNFHSVGVHHDVLLSQKKEPQLYQHLTNGRNLSSNKLNNSRKHHQTLSTFSHELQHPRRQGYGQHSLLGYSKVAEQMTISSKSNGAHSSNQLKTSSDMNGTFSTNHLKASSSINGTFSSNDLKTSSNINGTFSSNDLKTSSNINGTFSTNQLKTSGNTNGAHTSNQTCVSVTCVPPASPAPLSSTDNRLMMSALIEAQLTALPRASKPSDLTPTLTLLADSSAMSLSHNLHPAFMNLYLPAGGTAAVSPQLQMLASALSSPAQLGVYEEMLRHNSCGPSIAAAAGKLSKKS